MQIKTFEILCTLASLSTCSVTICCNISSNLREAVASDVSNTAVLVRRLVSTFSLPVLAQTTSFSASSLNRLATATANSLAQGLFFARIK
jgi:hypothetical protein